MVETRTLWDLIKFINYITKFKRKIRKVESMTLGFSIKDCCPRDEIFTLGYKHVHYV